MKKPIEEPITVQVRDLNNSNWHQIAIEKGNMRIVVSDPHQIDDLIIELIRGRNLVWPWPKFDATEAAQ